MNTLEQTIANFLSHSDPNLVDDTWESGAVLPFDFSGQYLVEERYLRDLHQRIRYAAQEEEVWTGVIRCLLNSLPDEIAHDFIDREICLNALGHSKQSETILRRLAPLVSEALLTLSGELYTNPNKSLHEFVELLEQYQEHTWMLGHLAHSHASSPEKERAFFQSVVGRKEWQVAQEVKAARERLCCEAQEQQQRVECARSTTNVEEIRVLSGLHNLEVSRALIQNAATPLDILEALSQSRNFGGAPVLRSEARQALQRLKQG